jgi:PPK2 family polyphosphate:nucleotide phosphotransferase
MAEKLIPPPGKRVDLAAFPTKETKGPPKADGLKELEKLRVRLDELQDVFIADARFALLVLFQAIDAGGKDGTIRSVFTTVDPLGVRSTAFKVPTAEELAHDYLWRIHAHIPAKGEIGIFNRSHYEDVLVVRVKELVPQETWHRRYDHINAFERMLTDEGTVILKFFLHVSKEEQRQRLQERVDDPKKQWKFKQGDIEERERWEAYTAAFEDMLSHCSTEWAPWHIIPGDRNWYRDLLVARTIAAKMESLGLRYPEPVPGVAGTKVV